MQVSLRSGWPNNGIPGLQTLMREWVYAQENLRQDRLTSEEQHSAVVRTRAYFSKVLKPGVRWHPRFISGLLGLAHLELTTDIGLILTYMSVWEMREKRTSYPSKGHRQLSQRHSDMAAGLCPPQSFVCVFSNSTGSHLASISQQWQSVQIVPVS